MNKRFKYVLLLLFGSLVFPLSSCQKKWKKPTSVSFNFDLNNNANNGFVKFTTAYLILSKISFKGERSQGKKEIESEQDFSSNGQVNFPQSSANSGIKFDIPQGTYSQIEIKIETSTDQKGNALQVNGTYADGLNKSIPVQFTFSAADVTSMVATNYSGGNAIVLIEDHPATATVVINPAFWFATVSKSMIDRAEQENVDGVQTIVINKDENENIYNLIAGRIKDGNEVIFN